MKLTTILVIIITAIALVLFGVNLWLQIDWIFIVCIGLMIIALIINNIEKRRKEKEQARAQIRQKEDKAKIREESYKRIREAKKAKKNQNKEI